MYAIEGSDIPTAFTALPAQAIPTPTSTLIIRPHYDLHDVEPVQEYRYTIGDAIRYGNNKAHRSKTKRIQEKKMKRNSKKRNKK